MGSSEMKMLNPWGGYGTIKNHLQVVHKISREDVGKYMTLCSVVSEKKAYDHLVDEIR